MTSVLGGLSLALVTLGARGGQPDKHPPQEGWTKSMSARGAMS